MSTCVMCGEEFQRRYRTTGLFCSIRCSSSAVGTPWRASTGTKRPPVYDRVMAKTMRLPSGCLVFQGRASPSGHGMIRAGESSGVYVHRIVWENAHGTIPAGMRICHRCDNPPCVELGHLFIGTQGDNIRDMFAKGRNRSREQRGEANASSRLRAQDVLDIRRRRTAGDRVVDLAHDFGVSRGTIYLIVTGRVWGHLDAVSPCP